MPAQLWISGAQASLTALCKFGYTDVSIMLYPSIANFGVAEALRLLRLTHLCALPCTPAAVNCSEEQGAVAAQGDGHERITVTLRKPMGMVLAEGKGGEVPAIPQLQPQQQQYCPAIFISSIASPLCTQ